MEPVTEPAPLATFLVAEPAREGDALPELAAKALHAIRTHLGMDVAFVSEFEAGQRVFRYVDAIYEDSPVVVGVGNPLEESYCQHVVDGRLPELIRDAPGDPGRPGAARNNSAPRRSASQRAYPPR